MKYGGQHHLWLQGWRLAALALLLGVCLPATAAPARIEDCEKISGADAYNYCLASFGPKRGQRAPAGAIGADPEANAPAFQRGKKSARRNLHVRNAHTVFTLQRNKAGKMTMEFTIGSRTPSTRVTRR